MGGRVRFMEQLSGGSIHWEGSKLLLFSENGEAAIGFIRITTRRERVAYAKVCIEINVDKTILKQLTVILEGGVKSFILIETLWLPSKCSKCCVFGHSKRNYPKMVTREVAQVWKIRNKQLQKNDVAIASADDGSQQFSGANVKKANVEVSSNDCSTSSLFGADKFSQGKQNQEVERAGSLAQFSILNALEENKGTKRTVTGLMASLKVQSHVQANEVSGKRKIREVGDSSSYEGSLSSKRQSLPIANVLRKQQPPRLYALGFKMQWLL
ncbi:hypothetical protein PTKIN_Ptkin16aG0008400 [Pterospermum kingtungense]